MPKLAIAFLTTLSLLAFPFNTNAIDVPSFSVCGSKWYQRLGLQLLEIEQAMRGGYSFDVACQAHDACYADCRTPKLECDNKLLKDAEGVCDNARNRQNCAADAQIFFQAVSEKGDMPFRQARVNCSDTSQQSYPDAGSVGGGGGGAASAAGDGKAAGPVSGKEAMVAGNDFGSAGSVSVGSVVLEALRSNEKQFFRFTPQHDDTYVIYARGEERRQIFCALHDDSFNQLVGDNACRGRGMFRLEQRLRANHTYYIVVRGQPGSYDLHIEGREGRGKKQSDDHGSSRWSATEVKVGSVAEGELGAYDDHDYFRFTPQHDDTYVIYARGEERRQIFCALHDDSFNQLVGDNACRGRGMFRLEQRLRANHTYYIVVRGQPGSYDLHIEGGATGPIGQGEHQGETALAAPCRSTSVTPLARVALKDKAMGVSWGYLCQPYDLFGLHAHAGVDFVAEKGTPVYAVTDGEVVDVDKDDEGHVDGIGKVAIRLTDGSRVFYLHLSRIDVRKGDRVETGKTQIGLSGQTGPGVKDPHLHIEVRVGYSGTNALGGASCGVEKNTCSGAEVAEKTSDPATLVSP